MSLVKFGLQISDGDVLLLVVLFEICDQLVLSLHLLELIAQLLDLGVLLLDGLGLFLQEMLDLGQILDYGLAKFILDLALPWQTWIIFVLYLGS